MAPKRRKISDTSAAGPSTSARNRRTGSNVPKSCKQCRKSKQRCDLPNRTAIQANEEEAQPLELACHRCVVLQIPCIVDYPPFEIGGGEISGSSPLQNQEDRDMASARRASQQQQQQRARQRSQQLQQQQRRSASPPSSSSSFHRGEQYSNASSSTGPLRRASSPLKAKVHKEVHLFDPDFQGHVINDSSEVSLEKMKDYDDLHPWAETDPDTAIKHLRPFPYLSRLCTIQPEFLISKSSSRAEIDFAATSLRLEQHSNSGSIDWPAMNTHLQAFQLSLPFLEAFHPKGHPLENVGIWLSTCLYLASTRSGNVKLQMDLLEHLRPLVFSCLLKGPGSMGEVASLVVMSLYEPLLLTDSVDKMQIDGSNLLAAASAATRGLDADAIPLQMRSIELDKASAVPLLRQCSLVISIALYCDFQLFMGSINRQMPLLQFNMTNVDGMEAFCRKVIHLHRSRGELEHASMLLLLLFRYRHLCTFEQVTRQQCNHLYSLPNAVSEEGERQLHNMLTHLSDTASKILGSLHTLRNTICECGYSEKGEYQLSSPLLTALEEDRCNMYIDYIELEMKQLHTTCQANLQDVCLLLVDASLGKTTNLSTLAQTILPNPKALGFMRILGRARTASCRKMAILLGNFADRWSIKSTPPLVAGEAQPSITVENINRLLAPPPAYLCAMVVPSIKSLCDGASGYLHLGAAPKDCLEEAQLDLAVTLIRAYAKALDEFTPKDVLRSTDLLQAKGHCDLFRMISHIATRTSHAIHEWTCNSKGLRLTSSGVTFRFTARDDQMKKTMTMQSLAPPTATKQQQQPPPQPPQLQQHQEYLGDFQQQSHLHHNQQHQNQHQKQRHQQPQQKNKQPEQRVQKINVPFLNQPIETNQDTTTVNDIPSGIDDEFPLMDPNTLQMSTGELINFESLLQEVLSTPFNIPNSSSSSNSHPHQ